MRSIRGIGWGIIVIGAVQFIIPFVGPLFSFGMGPDPAFAVTSDRVLRHVLPGGLAIVGGALLMSPSYRSLGAWLAVIGGAWAALLPFMLQVTTVKQFFLRLVYHAGSGGLILLLGAVGVGYLLAHRGAEAPREASETRTVGTPATQPR